MTNSPNIDITAYGETLTIFPQVGYYDNDRLAISFLCEEGPYGRLTVNLPNDHLNEGEFFVKDYAENEPMVMALLEAGWIKYQGREVQAGFCIIPIAKAAGPLLDFLRSNTPEV